MSFKKNGLKKPSDLRLVDRLDVFLKSEVGLPSLHVTKIIGTSADNKTYLLHTLVPRL